MVLSITLMARSCLAAKSLSYNPDQTFKPYLHQEITTKSCNVQIHRVESSRNFTQDQVNQAIDTITNGCSTHSGILTKPSNNTDTGGFQVTLIQPRVQ
ncbi:hypothetical protein PCASD_04963 [Puccinia coronata f. sp. avenae]|uniref:Uncharacterized protein n=1 Tax=Puccinia coronata f. sp. avenae TaxID=200324 RepID=A0A2N5VD53_9BASI|nr:hypothetical protein PCASD_04963 [Puccinia coronata f. sp. avenae]